MQQQPAHDQVGGLLQTVRAFAAHGSDLGSGPNAISDPDAGNPGGPVSSYVKD